MDNGRLSSSSPSNDGSFYSGDQQSTGGFTHGLGISLGHLILVILLSLVSYLCTRMQLIPHEPSNTPIHRYPFEFYASVHRHDQSSSLESGLDDDALGTFPKFPYSQVNDHVIQQGGEGGESCSICLMDYKESDSLRMLPDCCHAFHVTCVDHWLRLHPTCPVCRSSPVPSPLATPLAEVTPFDVRLS